MPTYNFEGFIVGSGSAISELAGTDVPLGTWSNSAYDWTTNSTTNAGNPVSYDMDDQNSSLANGGVDDTTPNANDGFIDSSTGETINATSYVLWNNSVITAEDSNGIQYTYEGAMYGIQLEDGTYIVHFQDPDASSFQGGESILTALSNDGLSTLDVTMITLGSITEYSYQRNPERFDYAWGTRPFVCFVSGTLIDTPDGQVAIDKLTNGDLVCTADNGAQKIRWIGKSTFARSDMSDTKLCPVRIRAGALGDNTPSRDLYVSRQHRVLINSRIAARMFGSAEFLIPAKDLLGLTGVELVTDFDEVTYYHIMFDNHEILNSNGAPTESMLAGPQALESLRPEQKEEILAIFPEFSDPNQLADRVRDIRTGKAARKLIERHEKNGKPMICA